MIDKLNEVSKAIDDYLVSGEQRHLLNAQGILSQLRIRLETDGWEPKDNSKVLRLRNLWLKLLVLINVRANR